MQGLAIRGLCVRSENFLARVDFRMEDLQCPRPDDRNLAEWDCLDAKLHELSTAFALSFGISNMAPSLANIEFFEGLGLGVFCPQPQRPNLIAHVLNVGALTHSWYASCL